MFFATNCCAICESMNILKNIIFPEQRSGGHINMSFSRSSIKVNCCNHCGIHRDTSIIRTDDKRTICPPRLAAHNGTGKSRVKNATYFCSFETPRQLRGRLAGGGTHQHHRPLPKITIYLSLCLLDRFCIFEVGFSGPPSTNSSSLA